MRARVVVWVIVAAIVVGGSSAARAEPVSRQHRPAIGATDVASAAGGPVTFQYRTTVDASEVGGKAFTPVRLIYMFDSGLAPGSGYLGSGPRFASYGPFSQLTLEVGNQCVTVSGSATATAVFDDVSRNPVIDTYDVSADTSAGATMSRQLFRQDLEFFQFLLVDIDATMFSGTALPLSPDFSALAEVQHVQLRFRDPATQVSTFVIADSGFEVSFHRPLESLQALLAEVDGLNVSASLKKNLTARLQSALDVLTDSSTGNDHSTAEQLQKFIQLVAAQAGKGIPATIAEQLIADAEDVINHLPPKGCS